MLVLAVALLAAALLDQAAACPGSPAFAHAGARVTFTVSGSSCATTKAEMMARIAGTRNWVDPVRRLQCACLHPL